MILPFTLLCLATPSFGIASSLPLGTQPPSTDPAPASARGEAGLEWPQWRGPNRDGRVGGTPWPTQLGAENLVTAWKVEGLGESYATPIVSADTVFTVGTERKRDEVVTAYDRRTGAKRWEVRWEGAMSVPFFAAKNGSWVRSTPAYDGATLYVGGMRDVLVALDAATGEERWRVDFVARRGAPLPDFGLVCSPLVVGDALYVQAGAALEKLDKATGRTIWRALDGGKGSEMDSAFSSPVLATIAGREQLIVQSRTHLSGVAPESGAVLWTQEVQAFRGMNILTPLVQGDTIFTSAYGGRAHLYTVARETNEASSTTEGAASSLRIDETWTGRAQGYMTSPVAVDGHAYLFLRSNRFSCVDLEDGADTYISPPTGDDYWSLIAQEKQILALSDSGKLRLIEASPASYAVRAEVDLVEGPSWAHLAVTSPVALEGEAAAPATGADIFVRSQRGLHAFRWRARASGGEGAGGAATGGGKGAADGV